MEEEEFQSCNKTDVCNKHDYLADKDDPYKQCPNSRESLGYFTWNYLHTMGIYYPNKPSQSDQDKLRTFMDTFAYFFPCKVCAKDLQRDMKLNPIKVESRQEFSIWLCEIHNMVNRKLGKNSFDCTFENLEKRWKTGFDYCNDEENNSGL